MMRTLVMTASIVTLLAGPAFADDAPGFLGGDAKYVTKAEVCTSEELDDALQISERGMFGYEFGCNFLDFLEVKDSDGQAYQFMAVAACGDDSGVTRPDLIMLTPSDDGMLRVTSQNDYVTQLARGDDGADIKWIVELEFTRCK